MCGAATNVNSSLLHFQWNLEDFGSHVFGRQTACTASEELQFMSLTNMSVPVEELQRFAMKTWQSTNAEGAQIQNVTYFDLETGSIVSGNTIYDWTRRLTYFNYSILLPNIVDMPAYQQKVLALNYTVSNLTTGETTASYSCQSPIPQLQNVSNFLNSILEANLSDSSSLEGGLRPTELKLPGGCISESNVNYEGNVLQSIRTGKTSQVMLRMIQQHFSGAWHLPFAHLPGARLCCPSMVCYIETVTKHDSPFDNAVQANLSQAQNPALLLPELVLHPRCWSAYKTQLVLWLRCTKDQASDNALHACM